MLLDVEEVTQGH